MFVRREYTTQQSYYNELAKGPTYPNIMVLADLNANPARVALDNISNIHCLLDVLTRME